MADVFSKLKRAQVMAAIRSSGNKSTEAKLAFIFRSRGVNGWRRNQDFPGKPDFVFRRQRLTVFVDGCFWHGCPKHGRQPASNQSYWRGKLARNHERDVRVAKMLKQTGWRVLRLWEHDLANPDKVANKVRRMLALGKHVLPQQDQ